MRYTHKSKVAINTRVYNGNKIGSVPNKSLYLTPLILSKNTFYMTRDANDRQILGEDWMEIPANPVGP